MIPIFVATKGRAAACNTLHLLGDHVFVVVEPQEEEIYRKAFPRHTFLVLPENDRGVTYARNFILNHAREYHDWFWMLDDDIKQAYFVVDKKNVKAPFGEVLRKAEEVLCSIRGLAVGALEYQQYSWSAKRPVAMNSYCDVAVLVNIERTTHLQYRDGCKEDRDFVLQALSTGYKSARSTHTSFAVPKNGSNKGGLHDAYEAGLEKHWSKKMIEMWPGVCVSKIKKDGRPDVKINWKLINNA